MCLRSCIYITAAQNPNLFGAAMKKAAKAWHDIAYHSMSEARRSSEMATICIAVIDGLLLKLIATGDRRRLGNALKMFIAMARAAAPPHR
jgi:hypothetical protein